MQHTGTHNIHIDYRATPRCLLLYSRSLRRSKHFGVGPPLHDHRSHTTLVTNITSNAVRIVTASRTPRATRRGSHKLTNDTVKVINLRYTFPLVCGCVILPKALALRGLITLVSSGPHQVFNLNNNLGINNRTSFAILTLNTRCRVSPTTFLSGNHTAPFTN